MFGAHSHQRAMESLASRAVIEGAHLWPQLGHAGALSHPPISTPKGPSPLDVDGLQCAGMSAEEVRELPSMYARTAAYAKDAGFSGVHVHAGHGFLLSQFLSPLFNRREDGYGGSIEARCRIVLKVIDEVRRAVGPSFPVGIKINSTDKLEGGLTEADALEVVRLLDRNLGRSDRRQRRDLFPRSEGELRGVVGRRTVLPRIRPARKRGDRCAADVDRWLSKT